MNGVVLWVVAAAILVVIVVVVVVVVTQRGHKGPEPTLDPPYDRKDVPNPMRDDPQVVHEADPSEVRHPDGPDNIRNPHIENEPPGVSTPRTFPPPGPPVD